MTDARQKGRKLGRQPIHRAALRAALISNSNRASSFLDQSTAKLDMALGYIDLPAPNSQAVTITQGLTP